MTASSMALRMQVCMWSLRLDFLVSDIACIVECSTEVCGRMQILVMLIGVDNDGIAVFQLECWH